MGGGYLQLLLLYLGCKTLRGKFLTQQNLKVKIFVGVASDLNLTSNCMCLNICQGRTEDSNLTCFIIRKLILKVFLRICWYR